MTPAAPAPGVRAGFSPARFERLLRADLAERWRGYAAYLLVVAVVHALLVVIMLSSRSYHSMVVRDQAPWYVIGLLISGYVFAHVLLAPWQRTAPTLLALMRPAAVSEKWALTALTLLVLYPLVYTVVFALIWSVASPLGYHARVAELAEAARSAAIAGNAFTEAPAIRADYVPYIPFLSEGSGPRPRGSWMYWLLYAGTTGYAAVLLVALRRAPGVKALALGIALLMATGLLLSAAGDNGLDVLSRWFDGRAMWADGAAVGVLRVLFWLGVPALLWLTSYFALRERDLA